MGVAIFAARKIALLNSINNLELMMTQLSAQQMSLTTQSMNMQMQQNNLSLNAATSSQSGGGNIWGAVTQGLSGLGGLAGGSKYGQAAGAIGAGLGMLGGALFGGGGGADSSNALATQQTALDNKLLQLQQQEKRLEMTMKQLETQLSMKNRELESVEKAEEKAINRATPKYDGGG